VRLTSLAGERPRRISAPPSTVRYELDDMGDTSGATDNDFVHVALVDLGVVEGFINRVEGAAEEVLEKLLEASTGDGSVEVDPRILG